MQESSLHGPLELNSAEKMFFVYLVPTFVSISPIKQTQSSWWSSKCYRKQPLGSSTFTTAFLIVKLEQCAVRTHSLDKPMWLCLARHVWNCCCTFLCQPAWLLLPFKGSDSQHAGGSAAESWWSAEDIFFQDCKVVRLLTCHFCSWTKTKTYTSTSG